MRFLPALQPDHLLRSGELLSLVSGKMQVVAYEHGRLNITDIPGVKQRLCAVKDIHGSMRDDGEPPVHPCPLKRVCLVVPCPL